MRKSAVICLCLILSFIAGSHLYAQNYVYATGNTPFTTEIPVENGYIAVNNGEIHIELPLATQTQRGSVPLNENLVYDSRIWQIVHNSGYSWQPTNVPNSMGGWRLSSAFTAAPTYSPPYVTETGSCGQGQPQQATQEFFGSFAWTDPQGTSHAFDEAFYQQLPLLPCAPNQQPESTSGYALDGSGYYMTATYDLYTESVDTVVYDKQGNEVYPALQDSNGNYMSADSSGNLVDTLGLTPLKTTTSGNQITYSVLTYGGARANYIVTTETVYYSTDFQQSAVSEASGSFTAIKNIQLPDGSSYSFTYDSGTTSGHYGEITSVTLPSGGVINYTWQNYKDSFQNENRWLQTRVKDGGTTSFQPATISSCSGSSGCQEKTTVTNPAGNDTVYTFTLDPGTDANAGSWNTGIAVYQGHASGGAELKSVSTGFTYGTTYMTYPGRTVNYTVPQTETVLTSLPDVGLTSKSVTTFDSIGANPVNVQQWDYYSGSAPSTPTEQTAYTYYSIPANGASIPNQVKLTDGSGNLASQTTYSYNQTTPATTSGLPNHTTAGVSPDNLTTVSQWINTSGSTLNTTMTYDDAGTLLTRTDSNGTTTYGHDSTDTFVTSTTPPTPSSGVQLATSATYDQSTGLLTGTTDPNGQTTIYKTYDEFGRPMEIDYPDGGKTTFNYTPTQTSQYKYQTSSVFVDTETLYDGYGRVSRVAVLNGQSANPWYQNDTCYDTSGNVNFRSYRYQSTGWNATKVCSGNGDSSTYDALGRVETIAHSDGTDIQYTYKGRATKVVNENGAGNITQTDGLGRTTSICEISSSTLQGVAPVSCGQDIAATGFLTSYSYDIPNHMTTITQGAQQRVFQTDSLGRSILTQEPERGKTTYSYAYNSTGLLVTRQRPQANQTNPATLTTTTTQYDNHGRVLSISYNDGGITPTRSYAYDQATNWGSVSLGDSKGHLTYAVNNANGTQFDGMQFAYDSMGRIVNTIQCLPGFCGQPAHDVWRWYTYDYTGDLTQDTYLTQGAGGTTVNTNYSISPAEEVLSISDTLTGAGNDAGAVLSNIQYGPFGPVSYVYGNGLGGTSSYDVQGRPSGKWLCKGSAQVQCPGTTQLYAFGVTWQGTHLTSSCDSTLGQCASYGYDEFNRLSSRNVTSGTEQNFTYVYDRYGNRWQQNAPQGGPAPQLSFNATNNQITNTGFLYDAAGNMINDGSHSYQYDAEGKLLNVDGGSTAQYVYDALDHSVKASDGTTSLLVAYNVNGQRDSVWSGTTGALLSAETYWGNMPVAFSAGGQIHYQHQDWVGTDRLNTTYSGSVEGSFQSLPFGDGFSATGQDNDTKHFALLDYDATTSTEHAQYRQLSSTDGRWMSPDPYNGSYDPTNPESFNRYAYLNSSPLIGNDPSGKAICTQVIAGGVAGPVDCAIQVTATLACGPLCGEIIGASVTALLDLSKLLGWWGGPQFNGSIQSRPSMPQNSSTNCDTIYHPCTTVQVNGSINQPSLGTTPSSLVQTIPLASAAYPWSWTSGNFQNLVPGTQWCGPGGWGSPTGSLDMACMAHDACYAAAGLSWYDNFNPLNFFNGRGAAILECNQQLCDAAGGIQGVAAGAVGTYFQETGFYACY